MNPHPTDTSRPGLPLTGERTVPGLAVENYWFRRHEVAYRYCAPLCAGQVVLEAGCGEGYGADLLASSAAAVLAVDYDHAAVAHVRSKYPAVEVVAANLAALPVADARIDVLVNLQVIEHLWDQPHFITECLRVVRPGGLLIMSTPNRITFTPGSDVPVNPFHTRELNAAELDELLTGGGFAVRSMSGIFHGAALRAIDARHGGSVIDAQIALALAGAPWPEDLLADVASVDWEDFDIVDASDRDIDDSLDLLAIAVRP